MRNPKISTKRVLGLALAAALAVGATVAVSSSSQAVTVPAATVTPKTGPAASTTAVISVTGKGFKSGSTVKVSNVEFSSAACASSSGSPQLAAGGFNVASATTLTATSVVGLTAGSTGSTKYFVCVYSSSALLGQGNYTVYTAPTVTQVNGTTVGTSGSLATVTGSMFGGSTLSISGTDFTKAAAVSIDGVAAKTTFVDDSDLTAVVPVHAAGTGYAIKVTDLGGVASSAAAPAYTAFSFLPALKVSPSVATGVSGDVITVTGKGFDALTFKNAWATTVAGTIVYLVKPGTAVTGTVTTASLVTPGSIACGSIMSTSDTSLTCKPATVPADGAWSVVMLTTNASDAVQATSSTGYSAAATYTVSDF